MLNLTTLDDRITKCKKILDENPDSQIFAAYADALRKNGELDKAFRICRQGLRMHPGYGSGHMVMARINFDRKMYDWAESELAEAIELEGRTRATDLLRAEIYIKKQKYDNAKIIINELVSTEPGNEYCQELLDLIELGKRELKRRNYEAKIMYNSSQMTDTEKSESEDRRIDLETGVSEISSFKSLSACFVTDCEGMMVTENLPAGFDSVAYAALSAEIYRFANENVGKIQFGKVKQILIELAGEKIWMVWISNQILVMVILPDANLGSLKLKVTGVLNRIKSV